MAKTSVSVLPGRDRRRLPNEAPGWQFSRDFWMKWISPSIGHEYTNKAALGGIKEGDVLASDMGSLTRLRLVESRTHRFTLGGIKDCPGVGHMCTLGGIKDGPNPGIGHKFVYVESLGDLKSQVQAPVLVKPGLSQARVPAGLGLVSGPGSGRVRTGFRPGFRGQPGFGPGSGPISGPRAKTRGSGRVGLVNGSGGGELEALPTTFYTRFCDVDEFQHLMTRNRKTAGLEERDIAIQNLIDEAKLRTSNHHEGTMQHINHLRGLLVANNVPFHKAVVQAVAAVVPNLTREGITILS
ncbi:hypothetical protein OSB04_007601 [Centaurea solstitialis]|uniref:Uncharacterized protein n=1 Tax=Centaurea solstitialis TaxID=347529 RepID=A0AA38TXZ1_9ASTR|nr:hypothetical protein OSB04_007601 [Centaurea solstitialis]